MDPFDRFEFKRRINWEAIAAFLVGALVAYFFYDKTGLHENQILTWLIVVGIGGLWYHLRRIV